MKIEQAKTREEFLQALQEEKEAKDWGEIVRMSRSVKSQVRELAKVIGSSYEDLDYSAGDADGQYQRGEQVI